MNNTTTQTETSAVQDVRDDVVENCRKALQTYRAEEAMEKFEQLRFEIFSSEATHFFLKDILNKCEKRDTVDNINNLEIALRLMKLKLKAGV